MPITKLFATSTGILSLAPGDKSELLDLLAAEAAHRLDRRKEDILQPLLKREKLGSTALGRGVAMPHTRLDWLESPLAILARLEHPVDFDARDDEPVDLVFLVLWPESESEGFLPALSDICRALRDPQLPRQLRQARSADEALARLQAADQPDPDAGP